MVVVRVLLALGLCATKEVVCGADSWARRDSLSKRRDLEY